MHKVVCNPVLLLDDDDDKLSLKALRWNERMRGFVVVVVAVVSSA